MNYLLDLGLTKEEIDNLKPNIAEALELFPEVVKENFHTLRNLELNNEHEVFANHLHIFLRNPDRLRDTFGKYDLNDLIRCLEKNDKVIEKLLVSN